MSWVILIVSGLLEAVWATALDRSEGFTRPLPVAVFLVASVISVFGLGMALKQIPVGTAYAVWTGIGAATTVAYAMATGAEAFTIIKLLLLLGLVSCVVGLKLVA